MRIRPLPSCTSNRKSQHGSAILIILTIIGIGAAFLLVSALNKSNQQLERDKITTAALAQAKEALVGYAASVDVSPSGPRPGDLPCPDTNNDGIAETSCGNASGSTGQNLRLGRLPWKSLGLPDLQDGYGERLWYAVSNNFKKNTRTGLLNSDTNGTITVRDSTGTIINNGTGSSAAIAVIIAPGSAFTRQDGVNQVRDVANANNPVNYLDISNGEDNAAFVDSGTDGFISGDVRDANNNIIVNDRILAITYDNLMPILEQRVAREVFYCLNNYAADPLNQGRLPWAADMTASAGGNYSDTTNTRFGRLPSTVSNTVTDSGSSPMKNGWTSSCKLNSGTWWNNWREVVFYAVADAYKPKPIPPLPSCGACLTVNPPSATANKQFAVFMASRRLPGVSGGQPRVSNADKSTITNYLEDQNATPLDDVFTKKTPSATFNDYVLYP